MREEFGIDLYNEVAGKPGETECLAGCAHCPMAIDDPAKAEYKGYNRRVLDALESIDHYLEVSGGRFRTIHSSQPGTLEDVEALPIRRRPTNMAIFMKPHTGNDDELCASVELAFDTITKLLAEARKGQPTKLGLGLQTKVLSNPSEFEIENVLLAAYVLLRKTLSLEDGGNAANDKAYLSIGDNAAKTHIFDGIENKTFWLIQRWLSLRTVFTSTLNKKGYTQNRVDTNLEEVDGFGVSSSTDISFDAIRRFTFTFVTRDIRGGAPSGKRSAIYHGSDGIRSMPIGLLNDHVWIGHSTRNVVDKSVRFSFEEFAAMVDKSIDQQEWLTDVVKARVLERRSQEEER